MPMTVDLNAYRVASEEEIRSAQMEVLLAVDKFCKENGIKYFLYYGSLLGAIRHKGYIPWDDDVDIAMLREDYDRFVESFHSERISLIAQGRTEEYPFYFSKVCRNDTVVIEDMGKEGYAYGAGIDVFPLDRIPNDPKLRKKMLSKTRFYMTIRNIRMIPYYKKRRPLKGALVRCLYTLCSGFSASKLLVKAEKAVREYGRYEGDSVADIMLPYGERSIVRTEWFSDTVSAPFEEYSFQIPADYDKILTQIYRDYMTPPPKEKQVHRHDTTVYIKK